MTSTPPVALITGVSSGIGAAIAVRLASAGFRVVGTSRAPQRLAPIPGVETLALDVTDDTAVRSVVSEVIDRTGRIDVLVNNAGLGIAGAAEESSIAQARSLFDTNFFGLIRLTNEVLPHMRRRGSGRIINISSVLGFLPAPYAALYAASKHAVEGYTESLDHELREYGVRALLVEPSYTRTDFESNMWEADTPQAAYADNRAAVRAVMTDKIRNAELPTVVADATYAAATDKRIKLRYPAGRHARQLALLKRIAPAAVLDNGIRKQTGLNSPRPTPVPAER
ncbi:putative ketoacyl reductase [Mycobacterium marinum]|uniref:oxidoreductase n=1 Tax=Mycobacterium marinum TaxID=1781 RepID=UPI00035884C1|nr:oxidoreductase [Mycobacterium marinum]AXN45566.1 Putative ketoacyl reductase [Mycobacterium marinum]AXN50842.1 Putative ketoacyl reductase [Mycobacterium marinum]EPQ75024.1 Oxidoreductase [Mycobacterium marinum str. Europe]RFZ06968.1 putative ketoacyl reductase [Mycobacterium marinum]RFZ10790.1 putative ketoacyl reductase [Mycobacterium marinum]